MAQAVAGTCRYLALDGAPLEAPAPAGGVAGEGASPAKLKGKKAKEARQAARAHQLGAEAARWVQSRAASAAPK